MNPSIKLNLKRAHQIQAMSLLLQTQTPIVSSGQIIPMVGDMPRLLPPLRQTVMPATQLHHSAILLNHLLLH